MKPVDCQAVVMKRMEQPVAQVAVHETARVPDCTKSVSLCLQASLVA